MRAKQLKEAIDLCLTANEPLLIVGAPAIGKSQIVDQQARIWLEKQGGGDILLTHPVCEDATAYSGLGFPSDDRTYAKILAYGNLHQMCIAKRPLIVILDDVGQATDSVQSALMQLVEARNVNGVRISEHVHFILCSNRRGDKANVRGIIEPLKSRCVVVSLEVNADDTILHFNNIGMPASLIAFCKFRPNLIHDFKPTTDMINSSSPRGAVKAGKLQLLGIPKSIEFETFRGCQGEQWATEYCAYLRQYRDMPDPELYLNDPTKELPKEESLGYALAAALSAMANKINVEKIYALSMRMDAEYSTFMIFSMIQRDKKMSQSAGMAIWAKKFADYLL